MYQNYSNPYFPPLMPGPGHYGIYPIPFMPPCVRLANAYVPYQCYTHAFPIDEALCKGTLFPELYMPYVAEKKEDKKCPIEQPC